MYSDAIAGSGLLASISNGSITYFQSDHLDWRVATNASGQVTGSQGHFPFGESWYSSGGNEFAFTSYQRDSESGLDYGMARYYDSSAGRMCSADPVGGDPEDPQTWNRYAYARNDPIDITDPNGQHWWNWVLDIAAVAAMIFQPEIDAFLSHTFGTLFASSTAGADSSFTPVLVSRTAAQAAAQAASGIAEGAGDAAAGASVDWSAGLALTAAASQAADQPKKPAKANTRNCFTNQALPQAFGPNAQNITPNSALDKGWNGGHFNFGFQAKFANQAQEDAFTSVLSSPQNDFIGPGSRIGVTITQSNGQSSIWGMHVEHVAPVTDATGEMVPLALSFVSHLDGGDPNWDVFGMWKHLWHDVIKGHRAGANLDPNCN